MGEFQCFQSMLTVYNNLTGSQDPKALQESKENISPNQNFNFKTPNRISNSQFSKVTNFFSPFQTESKLREVSKTQCLFQSEVVFENNFGKTKNKIDLNNPTNLRTLFETKADLSPLIEKLLGLVNEHQTGIFGTRFYRSPEVLMIQQYDDKSDIWSLACICLEMLQYCPIRRDFPENSDFFKANQFNSFTSKGPIFAGRKCEIFSPKAQQIYAKIDRFDTFMNLFGEVYSEFQNKQNTEDYTKSSEQRIQESKKRDFKMIKQNLNFKSKMN